ncbi:MAG: hypothetical protein ACXU86_02105 [Archangium sp.]
MEGKLRAWSIVALSLLCTVLIYVLVRTPPDVARASAQRHARRAPPEPAPAPRPGTQENPDMYRGWPMFFGWPLPQPPSSSGTPKSSPGPAESPEGGNQSVP